MESTKGYYSVIQFCPDPARAEAVNVGVLLFCPELGFIEARTRRDNDRVRRMFGRESFDTNRLNAAKRSIGLRLQKDREAFRDLDDLNKFIATRGNQVVLTPARSIRVSDNPTDLLEELLEELVGTSERPRSKPAIQELDDAMRRIAVQIPIEFNQSVTIPTIGTQMRIPYAYRNGRFNLVQPQVFRSNPISRAIELATAGQLLKRHPGEDGTKRKLIVVSEIRTDEPERDLRDRIGGLFDEFDTRVVWHEEIPAFAAEVEAEAH